MAVLILFCYKSNETAFQISILKSDYLVSRVSSENSSSALSSTWIERTTAANASLSILTL